jgi:hypothetical protein
MFIVSADEASRADVRRGLLTRLAHFDAGA